MFEKVWYHSLRPCCCFRFDLFESTLVFILVEGLLQTLRASKVFQRCLKEGLRDVISHLKYSNGIRDLTNRPRRVGHTLFLGRCKGVGKCCGLKR